MVGIDLHAYFWQPDLSSQFFAAVDVRIVRLVERLLQLMKLVRCERCTIPSMFLALAGLIVNVVLIVAAAFHVVAQNGRSFRFAVVSAIYRPKISETGQSESDHTNMFFHL